MTLEQHLEAVVARPEVYRPQACPHCCSGGLWRHGCYHRKADRRAAAGAGSRNPVAVLRFLCRQCRGTCSRLPLCIAPRRWYDWAMQQVVLALLLTGCSVHSCSACTGRSRRTVRRWRDWLQARGAQFAFCLRSRFPELGQWPDDVAMWRHVIDAMPLARAMGWLDRELVVP